MSTATQADAVTARRPPLAERQCLACGVVCECYPGLPCSTCGASSFHLIPLRHRAA